MPVTKKEPLWKTHLGTLKDLVFVVGIVITAGGWFTADAVAKSKVETKIEVLTKVIDNNNSQLEKINDILSAQQQLNGKIIQYMEMDKFANQYHTAESNDKTANN